MRGVPASTYGLSPAGVPQLEATVPSGIIDSRVGVQDATADNSDGTRERTTTGQAVEFFPAFPFLLRHEIGESISIEPPSSINRLIFHFDPT